MISMKIKLPFLKLLKRDRKTVSVVKLSGVIASGNRGAINDAAVAPLLEKAFRKGKPAAVAIVINSPGGSPVQSSLIGARIKRLSAELEVPTVAFVEDVAASGGYWLASAADEIYADEASVVGSIGVISAGFGAHELLARYGVERRVYTAGKSKSMLDPFRAENPKDVKRLKGILDDLHRVFISHVENGRGDKLDKETDLFTGEVWLAQKAKDLGLIDGIGHVVPMMKERFGEKVNFRVYGQKRPLTQRFGLSFAQDLVAYIEERAAFGRYGL